jgi:hypothetical protein
VNHVRRAGINAGTIRACAARQQLSTNIR